jgi:hypothetical protein
MSATLPPKRTAIARTARRIRRRMNGTLPLPSAPFH